MSKFLEVVLDYNRADDYAASHGIHKDDFQHIKKNQMETNLNQIEHIQKSNESFYAFMDKFAETIRAYQKHVEDLQEIARIAKQQEEEKNQLKHSKSILYTN